MKIRKTVRLLAVLALMMLGTASVATAHEAPLRANPVFAEASVYLGSSMIAEFSASTRLICSSIKVTSCSLQRKVNNQWISAGTLMPPSTIAYNTSDFGAEKDYSASCTNGYTYRIYAIFSAGGETVSRYSNEATYR